VKRHKDLWLALTWLPAYPLTWHISGLTLEIRNDRLDKAANALRIMLAEPTRKLASMSNSHVAVFPRDLLLTMLKSTQRTSWRH
jgi:hypothetical protein